MVSQTNSITHAITPPISDSLTISITNADTPLVSPPPSSGSPNRAPVKGKFLTVPESPSPQKRETPVSFRPIQVKKHCGFTKVEMVQTALAIVTLIGSIYGSIFLLQNKNPDFAAGLIASGIPAAISILNLKKERVKWFLGSSTVLFVGNFGGVRVINDYSHLQPLGIVICLVSVISGLVLFKKAFAPRNQVVAFE